MDAFHRHPKALIYLFLTELWERYGFYVVQGLLVLYMSHYFHFSDNMSYSILGIYTAMVYISPIVGGYLADRVLGFKTSIIWGGFFLIAGYALLAIPAKAFFFYPGLATIIVGNGLFKPNISSLLGFQYEAKDPRRDSGFTIFYIGINIGVLLAGFSSGYIRNYFGWHVSFALASIGLIIGLCTFLYGLKTIKNEPKTIRTKKKFNFYFLANCLIAILGLNFLLRMSMLADWLLPAIGIALLIYLTLLTLKQTPENKIRMLTLNILIISSIVFWMLLLQIFFSVNLFIDRLVNKDEFGFHLSTTVFYASESIFIILLGPLFAWLWARLGRSNRNPSPISKFVLGIFFAGLGYFALAIATDFPDHIGLINPLWVFFSYLLITIGELLLSPIGLSAVTRLAPAHLTGMMMGVWFVAIGFGGLFAGLAAKLSSVPSTAQSLAQKLTIYQHAFFDYAYIAFLIAILLYFLKLSLKRFELAE